MAGKPNILFILVDQMRRDSVAHWGGPVPTPNLDRLAREGVSFRQAYCVNPMCTPARAALLTGRFNHALRDEDGDPYFLNDRLLATSEVTLARSLRDAGYDCSYIGKWHTDSAPGATHIPRGPRRQGFDGYWAGINCGSHRTEPFYFTDDGQRVDCGVRWEPDMQTDLAIDYLRRAAKEEAPFFLMMSYLPPHFPFDLPPERQDLFNRADDYARALRPNVPARVSEEARAASIGYHANVMGIDDNVGRLLETVDTLGLGQETIVVFTSDHGDDLFSHGLCGKNQFYEEAAAIPLIIRWPGEVKTGVATETFVNLTDLAPTLLDAAATDIPARMQGKSVLPFLRGERESGPHDSAYLEINHPWWDYRHGQGPQGNRRCIVTTDWKLVLMESRQGPGAVIPWQLFERRQDPYETNNLANDPGCQGIICDLVKRMWEWMLETDDPFYDLTRSGIDPAAPRMPDKRRRRGQT